MTEDEIAREIPGVFVAALRKSGREPAERAVNVLGTWVHDMCEQGRTHNDVWREFVQIAEDAVAGGENAWLVKTPDQLQAA